MTEELWERGAIRSPSEHNDKDVLVVLVDDLT